MMENDDDHSSRESKEGKTALSPKAQGEGKYVLFVIGEILLGIAFCVTIYYYYFRKA